MQIRSGLVILAVAVAGLSASRVEAQHAGHDMGAMHMDSLRDGLHVMGQAIPLFTRANPTAGGVGKSQFALTQALAMVRGTWWSGRAAFDATLNGEGFSMANGELNTGAYGEGFVDKRHPHTYVHELMLSAATTGTVAASLSAGRGFASFGTDDPMMRPLVKYPVNHHLSQILERAVVIASARVGNVLGEASTFGGDEPNAPSSVPRADRFGDSWAVRGTIFPVRGMEVQGSYARVASPEQPGGFGLDQRKQSVSVRFSSPAGRVYGLAEWARTRDRDHSRDLDVFAYQSALAEGAVSIGSARFAIRLEQTERPEEERLDDPFRTPRPSTDLSIGGITRWRIATLHLDAPGVTRLFVSGFPFVELARLYASPTDARSIASPERLYGASHFWMVTAGIRVRTGMSHDRMGRYGVAVSK